MVPGEQRVVDEILASLEARYPTHEEEHAGAERWTVLDYLSSPGIWIALATFVPTFLAVAIGVPHFLASTPPRAVTAPATPVGWEWRGPAALADDAPTPRPSLETREPAASVETTAIRPTAPEPAPAGDSAWAPAAAFSDYQTAARLASAMHNQGYRVDVRREDSATRPWVVWIKANPQDRRAVEARSAPEGNRR
jgi:hypothetical protein